MKNNVYFVQVNYQYDNNVFLPYSVGMIQSYCQSIQPIKDNFEFKGFIYLRDDPSKLAQELEQPKVVGISCYIWNWEWSKEFARNLKLNHPDCLVVMGGPQVPVRSESFFTENHFVDLLVHYEGEIGFSEILLESLQEIPNFTKIPGLSVKIEQNLCCQTPPRERIADLDVLPSPYLEGVFDRLMNEPYGFHASQETHRGCPYSCTFCDWGSAVFTKVRRFGDKRLEEELEWFGKNRIELLYNCDANYGLFRRDIELTEKMIATKTKYGFPDGFRAAYAKNSDAKVFELAKRLSEAGMSRGVTLSVQSMDSHTLDVVRRSNIKIGQFSELIRKYHKEGVPTYTELIIGLPGESYDSFADGLEQLLEAGQHSGLFVYVCSVLPNSELGDPSYIKEHGIKFVRTPILPQHSSPTSDDVMEYHDVVVATNGMSSQDYIRTNLYCWAVQCFHCLGLTQYIAMYLHYQFDLTYRSFYEKLIIYAAENPNTLLGEQFQMASRISESTLNGAGWGTVLPEFGNIIWPLEEATFLNLTKQKETFYGEFSVFLHQLLDELEWHVEPDMLRDLLKYQRYMIFDPLTPKNFSFELDYDMHQYFASALSGEPIPMPRNHVQLNVAAEIEYDGDLKAYAQFVVWYGRKTGRTRLTNVTTRHLSPVQQPQHLIGNSDE